jgi:hypothetical protein
MNTRNAIVKDARIRTDDGFLTIWLDLDYGGTGQGFGGYSLYLPSSFGHHKQSTSYNFAGHFIWRVMEICDVTEWSGVIGSTIRVRQEHSGVQAIGHIVKDDWFSPGDDFKRQEQAA